MSDVTDVVDILSKALVVNITNGKKKYLSLKPQTFKMCIY